MTFVLFFFGTVHVFFWEKISLLVCVFCYLHVFRLQFCAYCTQAPARLRPFRGWSAPMARKVAAKSRPGSAHVPAMSRQSHAHVAARSLPGWSQVGQKSFYSKIGHEPFYPRIGGTSYYPSIGDKLVNLRIGDKSVYPRIGDESYNPPGLGINHSILQTGNYSS
jgi:hypothetical protein